MSDTAPATAPSFTVVTLIMADDGLLRCSGSPTLLPAKVYDRTTAVKYAAHEAQRLLTVAEQRIVVVSPAGRCVAVLAGGTGKPVKTLIAMRTKRALPGLMPELVKVKRRTSRVATGRSVAKPGKRRTSRAAR